MANLHTIKAYLYDNVLTDNPNDFVARVSSERSLGIRDICESAVARGGADISAASMEHAVRLWLREMAYNLCDGFGVNAEWFTAAANIRGVFDSPAGRFDPAKHSILFDFRQGSLLRRELEAVIVEILGAADASLAIMQATDVKTGSVNDLLTPSRNLRIAGSKIKIAGGHADSGVWFANYETGERTRVDASDIVTNNPSELIIVIPALAAGEYRLEITTQYGGTTLLKESRTAILDRVLTVN